MIGLGYYGTVTPPVILRNVLENPAWYTAYTPYQPEISQGRLEALLNFQTMVCDLTGLQTAGASLLDEGTAAAEAMTLMRRSTQGARRRGPRSSTRGVPPDPRRDPHPGRAARHRGRRRRPHVRGPTAALRSAAEGATSSACCCSTPACHGRLHDLAPLAAAAHEAGALVTAAADLLALTLATPPGEWGADVAVGTTQRFGVPMGFGGPHAATWRCAPGWSAPCPADSSACPSTPTGAPAYRLALQTREQHIRREKATRNICTAQVLLAVIAEHVRRLPRAGGAARDRPQVHANAAALAAGAAGRAALEVVRRPVLRHRCASPHPGRPPRSSRRRWRRASTSGASTPTTCGSPSTRPRRRATSPRCAAAFGASTPGRRRGAEPQLPDALRAHLRLPHPPGVPRHRSETAMLRYLRRLADQDLALDRAMIPLGSCTMKLNATTEMVPSPGRSSPTSTRSPRSTRPRGYRELIDELEAGCARSPATTRCRCSPTPARRASWPACSPSGLPPRARRGRAHASASSRPARTARTPPAR